MIVQCADFCVNAYLYISVEVAQKFAPKGELVLKPTQHIYFWGEADGNKGKISLSGVFEYEY